jgi:octaprenyl-diphosphate synthase
MRYGQPAIHKKYGVNYAIVATELLQCGALQTISAELVRGRFHNQALVLKILNQTMHELYVGQYLDVYGTANLAMGKRDYYRVIALGVGNFFGHLAQCGALLAGKPDFEVGNLARFGYHYGMALFVTDDIVDIIDSSKTTGKTYAADLKNRRMRLPAILTLQSGSEKDVQLIKDAFKKNKLSRAEVERLGQVIRNCGALDACRRIAKNHLSQAVRHLSRMKQSLTTASLKWLCDTLLAAQRLAP